MGLDFNLTGHNEHCPDCDTHLTSLYLCPDCGIRYEYLNFMEVDNAISGEETLGRFSALLFLRSLHYFVRGCLLIAGTVAGIIIVLIIAGLSWLSDLIFKGRR